MDCMDTAENYEFIRDLAAGNGGVARLMRYKPTGDLVAVKFIPRGGDYINVNVAREIINHRALRHPNVILFRRLFLTPTHLAISMEFAAGGDLLDLLTLRGPLSEDEARCFFQQVIAGVGYLHSMYVCHRDLKLENILLSSRGPSPRLKICDFGYSKSVILHSRPNSTVGTPAYIAPEVFTEKEYDGKAADVWSCGVILYVILVGEYPFADEEDRSNIKKTVERIMAVRYKIPHECQVSLYCRQLISRMLMKDPRRRIGIAEIKKHPWFTRDVRQEVVVGGGELMDCSRTGLQSVAEIKRIVEEARRIAPPPKAMEVVEQMVKKFEEDEVVNEVVKQPRARLGVCRSTG